jgi:dihydrofolate reductase
MEMRKLIEATLVSLDGVVGSPQEWALPRWDDENKAYAQAALADVGAFLLGRVTYEMFAAAWSTITGDPYEIRDEPAGPHADRSRPDPEYVPAHRHTAAERST